MNIRLPKYFTRADLKLCGIYFLYKRKKLVYIGQTINLLSRLYSHEIDFDAIRFIPCRQFDLEKYEVRWIKKFKPKNNFRHLYKMVGPYFGERKKVPIKHIQKLS